MVRYDLIRAKAKFALSYEGNRPNIVEDPAFSLKEAFHPLLFLINAEQKKTTVPFDLFLNADKRILPMAPCFLIRMS